MSRHDQAIEITTILSTVARSLLIKSRSLYKVYEASSVQRRSRNQLASLQPRTHGRNPARAISPPPVTGFPGWSTATWPRPTPVKRRRPSGRKVCAHGGNRAAARRAPAFDESQGTSTNSARQASTELSANDTRPPTTANAGEDAANATSALQVVVSTGIVTARSRAGAGRDHPEAESDEASAPAARRSRSPPAIVAAAVTVQIELATRLPLSVIESGDAITISNPPATIVAAPAETAANALARVALDTGDTPSRRRHRHRCAGPDRDQRYDLAAKPRRDVDRDHGCKRDRCRSRRRRSRSNGRARRNRRRRSPAGGEGHRRTLRGSQGRRSVEARRRTEARQIIASTETKGRGRTDARVAAERRRPPSRKRRAIAASKPMPALKRSRTSRPRPKRVRSSAPRTSRHRRHRRTSRRPTSEQPQPTGFGVSHDGDSCTCRTSPARS